MKGKIVGIKKTDTNIEGRQFKSTKFNLILDYVEKGLDGQDVGVLTWNELESGVPPNLRIGQDVEVTYNKKAKLEFMGVQNPGQQVPKPA
jgi:hypothetical protein